MKCRILTSQLHLASFTVSSKCFHIPSTVRRKLYFFFSRIGKLVTRLCIADADAQSGDQFASSKVMLKKKKRQKNITCWAAAFCWVQHNVVQECSLGEEEERAGFPL